MNKSEVWQLFVLGSVNFAEYFPETKSRELFNNIHGAWGE